jgi:SM-20-related protein
VESKVLTSLPAVDLDRIGSGGVVVRDGAVPNDVLERWLGALVAADLRGELSPAGVGALGRMDPRVRTDRTLFVTAEDPRWTELVAWVGTLGRSLAEGLRTGLPTCSIQLAVYRPGGCYQRHRDAIQHDPGRKITVVLYLDRGWTAEHGGELIVYPPDGEHRIVPLGGRVVLFRSDLVEHEIVSAKRTRYAMTAWLGSSGAIALP